MVWQRPMHTMWVEEDRRAGWHLHGELICLFETRGVGEKSAKLRAIVGPRQNTPCVTCANDAETAVLLRSIVKANHHVRQLINVIAIVYPVG